MFPKNKEFWLMAREVRYLRKTLELGWKETRWWMLGYIFRGSNESNN